MADSVITV